MPYLSGHPAGVARPDVVHGQRRALKRRLQDAPAYFDHAFPRNGPTEAIDGRLEHLRGIALGFTNLGNYITRSLLYAGDSDKPYGNESHNHEPDTHGKARTQKCSN